MTFSKTPWAAHAADDGSSPDASKSQDAASACEGHARVELLLDIRNSLVFNTAVFGGRRFSVNRY